MSICCRPQCCYVYSTICCAVLPSFQCPLKILLWLYSQGNRGKSLFVIGTASEAGLMRIRRRSVDILYPKVVFSHLLSRTSACVHVQRYTSLLYEWRNIVHVIHVYIQLYSNFFARGDTCRILVYTVTSLNSAARVRDIRTYGTQHFAIRDREKLSMLVIGTLPSSSWLREISDWV